MLYENDKKVIPCLRAVVELCRIKMKQYGDKFNYSILEEDLILDNRLLFENNLFEEPLKYQRYDE